MSGVKSFSLTEELRSKLAGLSILEERGILGVRVKSVDIKKNTCGEGASLGYN
jgi:hypothetical protein